MSQIRQALPTSDTIYTGAFNKGRFAHGESVPRSANPYAHGTRERVEWIAGWWWANKNAEVEELATLKRPSGTPIWTDTLFDTSAVKGWH